MAAINQCTSMILDHGAVKATKYESEKQVVTATRRLYGGKINKRGNVEILLKIGRPNYAERKFIKMAKKAGEPFPIRKIQVTFPKEG